MGINMLHAEITDKIIKAFFKVYNTLGYGFLEKVYENALVVELNSMGLHTTQQKKYKSLLRRSEGRRLFCRYYCK